MEKVVFVVWCVLLVTGMAWISDYSTRPGNPGAVSSQWPGDSAVTPGDGLRLLVFVHPRCPCTRATMRQLERLAHRDIAIENHLEILTLCFIPGDKSEQWAETAIWNSARRIGEVRFDQNGVEAECFGVSTSGHVILFDGTQRIFDGGVTAGRGHEGEPPAYIALLDHLSGAGNPGHEFPVFGCGLFEEGLQ